MLTDATWQHDLLYQAAPLLPSGGFAPPAAGKVIETGTKLFVSNLDYGVSTQDLTELFAELGPLKRCAVHYDVDARSKGTGDVVYARRVDAEAAISQYNNVQLDGKPMVIEMIGQETLPMSARLVAAPAPVAMVPRARVVQAPRGRGFAVGRGARGGSRGRGRGGRGGRQQQTPKTQEELDAELDTWKSQPVKAEPMQT